MIYNNNNNNIKLRIKKNKNRNIHLQKDIAQVRQKQPSSSFEMIELIWINFFVVFVVVRIIYIYI